MPNRSDNANLTYLPVPAQPAGIAPVGSVGKIAPVEHALNEFLLPCPEGVVTEVAMKRGDYVR